MISKELFLHPSSPYHRENERETVKVRNQPSTKPAKEPRESETIRKVHNFQQAIFHYPPQQHQGTASTAYVRAAAFSQAPFREQ